MLYSILQSPEVQDVECHGAMELFHASKNGDKEIQVFGGHAIAWFPVTPVTPVTWEVTESLVLKVNNLLMQRKKKGGMG